MCTIHYFTDKIGLTGGYIHRNKAISGTVMITQNSQVGRICSHSLDNRAANVMCKQLGFAGGVSYVHQDTQYRAPVFLLSLSCSGSESSIDDCLINKTTFVSSCDHAGVLCYESSGEISRYLSKNETVIAKRALEKNGIVVNRKNSCDKVLLFVCCGHKDGMLYNHEYIDNQPTITL